VALRSRSFRADRIAWVVFVVLIVGASVATRAWLHRRVRDVGTAPVPLTLDYRLAVLAYERVDGGAQSLPPERLAEHFEALRAAGFHPVSLAQVRDAYRGGAPLPERPILITFDGGHLSTYEAADPLLRRLKWPAVMFLDPRLQEERHATYVYWDRLQRMVDSGLWDVGTVGRWRDAAGVVERHLASYRVLAIARRAGVDEGAGGDGAPAVGFENGWFGVNGPDADPLRLLRIRVPVGWSGDELVHRLRASLAAPALGAASGDAPPVGAAHWACSIGRLESDGDAVTLTGAPRAEAWLAGTEWARDFVLEAEVRVERGPFWVVQQAVASRDAWRWGGTERKLYLQRVRPGTRIDVLARKDVEGGAPWHELRVVKRGDGVWVEWDGLPVGDLPRAVAARWSGYVGFSTGSPKDPGRLLVRRVRFAAIPYQVRAVSASPSDREIRSLLADAPRLAGISPPGFVLARSSIARQPADLQLLTMLAARGAWDLVPTVELTGEADTARAAELADVAARQGWAGVRVIVRGLGPAGRAAWGDAAPAWRRLFDRRGLRLVLEPPAGSAR
jgi:hypothetical protein